MNPCLFPDYPVGGHGAFAEQPGLFNQHLRAFLRKHFN